MKETVRDRLLQFINELGISSRMFEQNCGLSNGFVRNTGDSIRRNNLEKISTIYPDLNTTWLLTGDGNKLNSSAKSITSISSEMPAPSKQSSKGIPYFDVDVTMGYDELPNDQTNIPNYYLHIPAFQNCDCAVPAYGRSMIPDINDGSIIAIKEVSLDSVLPGEAYLIITDEYRTVKYIRNCKDNPNKWRLVPKNLEEFDEMIIDKTKVLRVFLVKGVITNKIL